MKPNASFQSAVKIMHFRTLMFCIPKKFVFGTAKPRAAIFGHKSEEKSILAKTQMADDVLLNQDVIRLV